MQANRTNMGEGEWDIEDPSRSDPNLILVEREEKSKQLLSRWLNLAISALGSNLSATDVVELITREVLQTHPLFTAKGSVDMESCIVENPTSLMDTLPHSFQDRSGVPDFVDQQIPLALINQPNIQACFGMGSGGGHSTSL